MSRVPLRVELAPGCTGFEPRLHRLVDGELGPAEAARVRRHARRCERCRQHLEWLRLQTRALGEAMAPRDPDLRFLWERRLRSKLRGEQVREAIRWVFRWFLLDLVEDGAVAGEDLPPSEDPTRWRSENFSLRRERLRARRGLRPALRLLGYSPAAFFARQRGLHRGDVSPDWPELQAPRYGVDLLERILARGRRLPGAAPGTAAHLRALADSVGGEPGGSPRVAP